MAIVHFPGCTADYPEKAEGEAPQAIHRQELDEGEWVLTCVDCGAFEIVTDEGDRNGEQ